MRLYLTHSVRGMDRLSVFFIFIFLLYFYGRIFGWIFGLQLEIRQEIWYSVGNLAEYLFSDRISNYVFGLAGYPVVGYSANLAAFTSLIHSLVFCTILALFLVVKPSGPHYNYNFLLNSLTIAPLSSKKAMLRPNCEIHTISFKMNILKTDDISLPEVC